LPPAFARAFLLGEINMPRKPDTASDTDTATASASSAASSSSASIYVYSTLANDQQYIDWRGGGGDMPIRGRAVLVKGGTGVANARIVTPLGVATEISAEDAAFLETNPLFKLHAQNGHVTIQRKKDDPEKVASDMNLKDPAAPKTPADYADAAQGQAKPRE
jgi:hypothetical protein